MECPYCGAELILRDYYGNYLGRGIWNKKGDIYKCDNEECESEMFNYYFYTNYRSDDLYEGYPC